MPESEAHRPHPGARHQRDPALIAVVTIAVGLGLATAAGPVFGKSGTTASVSDAIVPAVVGGLAGAAVCAVALVLIRVWVTRHWPIVRSFAITAAVCALGLGALAGASTAPTERMPEALVASGGAATAIPTGSVAAAGVVVPVDRDADGEPDTSDGQAVLGFDVDGDDVVDGFLRWCSREPDPLVAEREGYLAIDLRCDSSVDEYLPFDDDRILSELLPSTVIPDHDDGIGADTLITVGLIIMLLALLLALGFFLSHQALRERPFDRKFVALIAEPDEPVDVDKVADLLQASLDEVLIGADPRLAIRVAYGTLLDGLAHIGFPRRPEEGPDEHIERCLQAAELPASPIRELLRLFALARFSEHAITEAHRDLAIAALHTAIAGLRRLEVVG
jgi:hypothetical protein